jgi:hypothetical protein
MVALSTFSTLPHISSGPVALCGFIFWSSLVTPDSLIEMLFIRG